MTTQMCMTCNDTKSLDDFHRNRNEDSGRDPRCKECANAKCKRSRDAIREAIGTGPILAPYSSKDCTICGKHKSLEEFYVARLIKKDGRSSACRLCLNTQKAQRRKDPKNREKERKQSEEWHANNLERAHKTASQWKKSNPGRTKSYKAKQRAAKISRTPTWSEVADIQNFYDGCPESSQVDHAIPLQGQKVSGLHVLKNLQYLSAEENQRKHNKFDPADHLLIGREHFKHLNGIEDD